MIAPPHTHHVDPAAAMDADDLFPGFTTADLDVEDGVHIRVRTGGRGQPLLLHRTRWSPRCSRSSPPTRPDRGLIAA
jgi:hypothetical protein